MYRMLCECLCVYNDIFYLVAWINIECTLYNVLLCVQYLCTCIVQNTWYTTCIYYTIILVLYIANYRGTGSHQTYFEEIRQLFFRDEYSLLAEKWNAQRAQAVAHALLKVLYPLMEKELRAKLLTEAKEHVLQVSSSQWCCVFNGPH